MRRSAVFGAAVLVASVGVVAVGTTEANAALPSSAALVNSAGVTNGCTGEISFTRPASSPTMSFLIKTTCPAAANVHHIANGYSLYEVNPDGTWRQRQPWLNPSSAWGGAATPTTSGTSYVNVFCDDPGTHTWVARGSTTTKSVRGSSESFTSGVLTAKLTTTCP